MEPVGQLKPLKCDATNWPLASFFQGAGKSAFLLLWGVPWGRLGPSLGRLGAILDHLGAILGRLGAILAFGLCLVFFFASFLVLPLFELCLFWLCLFLASFFRVGAVLGRLGTMSWAGLVGCTLAFRIPIQFNGYDKNPEEFILNLRITIKFLGNSSQA